MERERKYEDPANYLSPDYSQLECDQSDNPFVLEQYNLLNDPAESDNDLNNPSQNLKIGKAIDSAHYPVDFVRKILCGQDVLGLMDQNRFVPLREVAEITTKIIWENPDDNLGLPVGFNSLDLEESNDSVYDLYIRKLQKVAEAGAIPEDARLVSLEKSINHIHTLEDVSEIWMEYGGVKWEGMIYSPLYLEYVTYYIMRNPDKTSAIDLLPDVGELRRMVGLLAEKKKR